VIGPRAGGRRWRCPTRAPEEGIPAASESAIGKKRLVRSVRKRTLARPREGYEAGSKVRATSQNAIGKKISGCSFQPIDELEAGDASNPGAIRTEHMYDMATSRHGDLAARQADNECNG
jgi:hypothetical protein